MAVHIANGWGDSIDEPSAEQMRRFLEELDPTNEHGAAWISDDEGNVLEWNVDGRFVYDNWEKPPEPRHMVGVSIAKTIELWRLLAQGRLHELEQEPWQLGTHPPTSPEEAARRVQERAELQLAGDREFFAVLGAERPDVPCRQPDCDRGAVLQSVFCRIHHFEQIMRRPCPFCD
jgi:hypothetical protein